MKENLPRKKVYLLLLSLLIVIVGFIFLSKNTEPNMQPSEMVDKQKDKPTKSTLESPHKKLLPDRIIGGFLDMRALSSANNIDMKKVADDGYNVIIIANTEVYGTDINFSSNSLAGVSNQTFEKKIAEAKSAGLDIVLGVGGIPNTFYPGAQKNELDPKIIGEDLTDIQINTLANNIVKFLKKYDIKGIVFGIRKFVSPGFLTKLIARIKHIDSNLAIILSPKVNDYKLVTTGHSDDYSSAIKSGNVDYLFIQEYDEYPQYDPNFISESYDKIIQNAEVPFKTKVLIMEPTDPLAGGGVNTVYHPMADATNSLTTSQAVALMLPQLEKIKLKPRFSGIVGWTLNADYTSDLYDDDHKAGSFALGLRNCIYKNICDPGVRIIKGPVVAGFLPLWGKSSTYNISGRQLNSNPISIKMPEDKEYCDESPEVCKYNVFIVAYLTYTSSAGFKFTFSQENGDSKEIYSPQELKEFIGYMKQKGKHVIVSIGGKFSYIEWQKFDFDALAKIVDNYGFDGVNFDLSPPDLPQNKQMVQQAAKEILEFVRYMKSTNPDFWLTFSPVWTYIVAPLDKNGEDNIYRNQSYADLINEIGVNNINYIWLNTYGHSGMDGILGFYKGPKGNYMKITSSDGYPNFMASLAWALTTQEGYDVNKPKYQVDRVPKIPANKLVFTIPAIEGVTARGMVYALSTKDINNTVELMEKHKASFGGFALWSIDFDAMKIDQGELSVGYSHQSWSTTDAIASIKLPPIVSQVVDKSNFAKAYNKKNNQESSSIMGAVIKYPDNIGTYDGNTIISYQGSEYKCISQFVAGLCNDKMYMPNGLHGGFAWKKIQKTVGGSTIVNEPEKIIVDGVYQYPSNIGSYSDAEVVISGDKKYECIIGKQVLCNNLIYAPYGAKGYLAWSDITKATNIGTLIVSGNIKKPKAAEYVYPNGITSYAGGTTVAIGNDLYRCRVGPESKLCSIEAYDPSGEYGKDAWAKIN
ncbi:glycoside hydrolase family 18 protein [Allofrancisella guangzhouensis]|uniref:glycosyl hydrolase family 18 protein n=1 Tax=Allofrancisella guangzhouensis TaxID=594679 RepID=UPI000A060764|nr:glycosyl hydrolase family 18 protein [Allofrancisella guangzhouensis]